ncbi:MAG TPA: hypothetical protein VME21_03700 [Steroidobacteraceae bacterium]|nr:hypothetical protein [Steroidobacteraceae bacterium]
MKLRIRGQSLRLRATAEEVRELAARGRIESQIRLSVDRALVYRVATVPEGPRLAVDFRGDVIEVRVAEPAAREWCDSDLVTLAGTQHSGEVEVRIVLEKDFDSSD